MLLWNTAGQIQGMVGQKRGVERREEVERRWQAAKSSCRTVEREAGKLLLLMLLAQRCLQSQS